MPETATIGAHLRSQPAMGSSFSPNYSNGGGGGGGGAGGGCPVISPKSSVGRSAADPRPTLMEEEEEVNRKVMEILKRMTAEKPVELNATPKPPPLPRQSRSGQTNHKPPQPVVSHRPAESCPVSKASTSPAPLTRSPLPVPFPPPPAQPAPTPTGAAGSAAPVHRCSCSRSSCLKLYCECFAAGSFCGDCSCVGCFNLAHYEEHRQKAIERIVHRKPDAFHAKIGHSAGTATVHVRGCNCRRSGCLKNYCECFEARVRCTNRCRCKYCYNVDPVSVTSTASIAPRSSQIKPEMLASFETHGDEKSSSHSSVDSTSPAASLSHHVSAPGVDVKVEPRSEDEVMANECKREIPIPSSTTAPNSAPNVDVPMAPTTAHDPAHPPVPISTKSPIEQLLILGPPLQSLCQPKLPQSDVNQHGTAQTAQVVSLSIGQAPNAITPPNWPTSFIPPPPSLNGLGTRPAAICIRPDLVTASTPCVLTSLRKTTTTTATTTSTTTTTDSLSSIAANAAASNILTTWLTLVSNASASGNSLFTPQALSLPAFTFTTGGLGHLPVPNNVNALPTTPIASDQSSSSSSSGTEHLDPVAPPCPEIPARDDDQYTAEELATFEHLLRKRRLAHTVAPQPIVSQELEPCVLRTSCDSPAPASVATDPVSTHSVASDPVLLAASSAILDETMSSRTERTPQHSCRSRPKHSPLLRRIERLNSQIRQLRRALSRQDRLIRKLLRRRAIALDAPRAN